MRLNCRQSDRTSKAQAGLVQRRPALETSRGAWECLIPAYAGIQAARLRFLGPRFRGSDGDSFTLRKPLSRRESCQSEPSA
jgi:hypothetical protein